MLYPTGMALGRGPRPRENFMLNVKQKGWSSLKGSIKFNNRRATIKGAAKINNRAQQNKVVFTLFAATGTAQRQTKGTDLDQQSLV